MTELEALRSYHATGDAEAFRHLVLTYQRLVYSACRRVLDDPGEVEDAAQEAFLKLAREAGRIERNPGSWLYGCALGIARHKRRSALARAAREQAWVTGQEPMTITDWEHLSPLIDDAIARLPEDERELVVRHFLLGQPQTALAAEAGVSRQAVGKRLEKAIEGLREHLRGLGVAVPAVALAGLLAANAASAEVPPALTAELCKIGLAAVGRGAGAAAGAVGTVVLAKKLAAVVVAILLAAGSVAIYRSRLPPAPIVPQPLRQPTKGPKMSDRELKPLRYVVAETRVDREWWHEAAARQPAPTPTDWLPLAPGGDPRQWGAAEGEVRREGEAWVFAGPEVRAEVGGMSWDNYVLSAEVQVRHTGPNPTFCLQLTGNGTCIYCQLQPAVVCIAWYCPEPPDQPRGFTHLIAPAPLTVPTDAWFTFQMKAADGTVTAIVAGKEIAAARIPAGTAGMPGLLVNQQRDCEIRVRNLQVQFLRPTAEQLWEYERDAAANWRRYCEVQERFLALGPALAVRLTEVLGTAEVVAPGERFCVRGEYLLRTPVAPPLILACQGTSRGVTQTLDVGDHRFELTAEIREVAPGQSHVLDLFLNDDRGPRFPALIRLRLGEAVARREGDRVWIEGLPDVDFGGDNWQQYLLAMQTLLRFRGVAVELDELLALSGDAFNLCHASHWQGVAYLNTPTDPIRNLAEAYGFAYATTHAGHTGPLLSRPAAEKQRLVAEALAKLRAEIDAGRPVLLAGAQEECGRCTLAVGYDRSGTALCHVGAGTPYRWTPIRAVTPGAPDDKGVMDGRCRGTVLPGLNGGWFANPLYLIGERTTVPTEAERTVAALRRAVAMHRAPAYHRDNWGGVDYFFGQEAYEQWEQALRTLDYPADTKKPQPGDAYDWYELENESIQVGQIVRGRSAAAAFCRRAAWGLPLGGDHLHRAARFYDEETAITREVFAPFLGHGATDQRAAWHADAANCRAGADAVRRMLQKEQAAISELEAALAAVLAVP